MEIHDETTQEHLNVAISLLSWPVWIGLRRSITGSFEQLDSYRWLSSDRPLTYSNWATRQNSSDLTSLSEHRCVYLSTASLRIGNWERTDCSTARMGFGCQVPLSTSNVIDSAILRKAVTPIWDQPENPQGQICYLGTCYSLIHGMTHSDYYEDAKSGCGKQEIALPRNPLEVSFLRTLLRHRTNATHAWVGIEVTHSKDSLVFPRIAAITPWLTTAIHQSQSAFSDAYSSSEPEKICFVLDAMGNTSRPPFDRGACYEDEEDSWDGNREIYYDHMEEEEDFHKKVGFCTTPMTRTVGVCPKTNGHDAVVDWVMFGDKCYAVMSDCSGESVLASVKSPDVDMFINWLLPGDIENDESILIGGIVNETHPLSIKWQDGSIGGNFHRLNPRSLRLDGSLNGLCLAIEPKTGWWKAVDCEGHAAPRWRLCSVPVQPINPDLKTPPPEATKKKVSCPTDFLELKNRDEFVRCYSVRHGGLRSHGHDWRMAERACRRIVSVSGQTNRWEGHLASIANGIVFEEIISLLHKNGYIAGISKIGNNLPVHMLKPSELVWIGLSTSQNKPFWNNWTDGSQGDSEFFENRIRQEESIFTDTNSNFFEHGSCIALHLPSGSWYALRCTLDLGYLCQATPTSENQSDSSSTDHFDSPKCLLAFSAQQLPSPETGFIQDPDVDCGSEGFTYFNGQCFRVIVDKFMSFTDAQSYCHELGARHSKNGEAGLAVYRSEADQVFVASQLSNLPKLPPSPATYGRGSGSYSRLEVIWRRYHWVGMFLYRHAFHQVDERVPCYIAHELNRPLSTSVDGPLCVSMKGVPDTEHFGSLSLDMGCEERLPFVCSFEPSREYQRTKASSAVCPRGYATHHSAAVCISVMEFCPMQATTAIYSWPITLELTRRLNQCVIRQQPELVWPPCRHPIRLRGCELIYPLIIPKQASALILHRVHGSLFVKRWIVCLETFRNAALGIYSPLDWFESASSFKVNVAMVQRASGNAHALVHPAHQRCGLRRGHLFRFLKGCNLFLPSYRVHIGVRVLKCLKLAFQSISMTSYELDMVAVNCTRRLSPLCETDPLNPVDRRGEYYREHSTTRDQRDYVGDTMFTESNKACIRWDLIKPTNRSELEALQCAFHNEVLSAVSEVLEPNPYIPVNVESLAFQPVLSASSNWCRNPNGLRDRAFCYTSIDQWEYCQLPEMLPTTLVPPRSTFHDLLDDLLAISGAIFIPLFIVGLCLGLAICYCRKSRRCRSSNHTFQEMILRRVPFAWRWRRSGSQPCLLAESVSYSVGTAMISDSTTNLITSDPKA
ncbi:unnamed protein product [Rodentolepis nana]|uniref:C-type lectin domain-containing protein n=1 Tax=Rodentolepis nana TaxID=102285 RepID=A0A0R3TZ68_RODNA|nr:unnamed protein product [Rodentolepis nana]